MSNTRGHTINVIPAHPQPDIQDVRNATKMAVVLLVRANEYIKSTYRRMLSINHAAKTYNITLPDYIAEDCNELNQYNTVYDLLKTNGKINHAKIGSPAQLVDIQQFKQIYQPVYNRALVVSGKYPFIQRAIMEGKVSLPSFMENTLPSIEYSAKVYYLNKSNPDDDTIPSAASSSAQTMILNINDYLLQHYDSATKSTSYSGDMYFSLYSERLFEHLYETPDIYQAFVRTNNVELCGIMCGGYSVYKRNNLVNPDATTADYISDTDEEIDINDFII